MSKDVPPEVQRRSPKDMPWHECDLADVRIGVWTTIETSSECVLFNKSKAYRRGKWLVVALTCFAVLRVTVFEGGIHPAAVVFVLLAVGFLIKYFRSANRIAPIVAVVYDSVPSSSHRVDHAEAVHIILSNEIRELLVGKDTRNYEAPGVQLYARIGSGDDVRCVLLYQHYGLENVLNEALPLAKRWGTPLIVTVAD